MFKENIFQLPNEFVVEPRHEYQRRAIISAGEIGRLTIAGYVEALLSAPSNHGFGDPLILVDGEYGSEPHEVDNGLLLTFYGAMYQRQGRDYTQGFSLRTGQWEHMVHVPADGSRRPWVYYGNAVWPPDADAVLFDQPIAYDQDAFELAVKSHNENLRD